MTLVIATSAGIWADRKITSNDGQTCDPLCKVAANEVLVAGFAGGFSGIIRGVDMVRDDEGCLRALAQMCDEKRVTGLAVKNGRIYLLEAGRVFRRPAREAFFAIGSGSEPALAYLSGGASLTDKRIRAAHRYVAKSRDDCGRGVDFAPCPT